MGGSTVYHGQIFTNTTEFEEDTTTIDHILGPIAIVVIILVLIIIIIGLIVLLYYHRRKYSRSVRLSSSAQGNNVYPNPAYQDSSHLNGELNISYGNLSQDKLALCCTSLIQ